MTLYRTFPKYPKVSADEFRDWNENMFKKYHNERVYNHSNPVIRYVEKQRVNKLIKLLGSIKKRNHIMAAGCGEGYIENKLPECKLYMVDISKEAIIRAKTKLKDKKGVTYKKENLEKLSFSNEYFDKIECSEVIEHVLNPEQLMNELNRTLKKGGTLVISFPNEPLINNFKSILIRLRLFHRFFPGIPTDMLDEWHLRSFELNRFKEVLGNNWHIDKVDGAPYRILPIRYILKCTKV